MDRTIILSDLTLLPGSLQPINPSIVGGGDQQPSIVINRFKKTKDKEVKPISDQQTMVANRNAQNTTLPFKTFAIGLSQNKITPKVLESGDRMGKYVIDNIIGEGAYSNVYSAHHIYLKHQVAIKALKPSQKVYNAIFLQEAQVLALLSHNNIVRVIDADIWEEVPFIALERLIGNNLSKILHKYKCLTIERTMDLMEDIGAALVKQEENGILHLDIKPDNIFQRTDGKFCLYDYGMVGIVRKRDSLKVKNQEKVKVSFSSAFGTPAYMSPEQAEGKGDNRSDLFSLGLTIWESLVGYKSRNSIREMSELKKSVISPIDSVKVKRNDVPEGLDLIINSLLEISPDDRYQSASDFLDDLYSYRYKNKKPFGSTIGTAFIATPFSTDFDNIYNIIESACENNRLRARRLDKHTFYKDIWQQCVQEIEISMIVIADFTGIISKKIPNPNVITEAAHARAINKPLFIISQGTPEDLPFDWRNYPIIIYENSLDGLVKLEKEIRTRINDILSKTFSNGADGPARFR